MEEFSIELGAKLKLDSLQEQINKASSNLKPLEITINTEKSEKKITALTEQISKLNNGFKIMENMGSLSSNLDVIDKSLRSIATVIDKINKADGFNNLGKGLSSFAPVVEMIKNELSSIKTAMESFKGLNINIGLGGTNNQTAYNAANRMALAELRQQETALESAYGGFLNMSRRLNSSNLWNLKDIADDSTAGIQAQVTALQQYINAILAANTASARGIDLTPITSTFSGSANEIVANVNRIATGEQNLTNQTNQLKGLFGSGIDAEKLTTQLDTIKVSIDNVSTAISGIKFDDSTLNTFKETISSLNLAINQLSTSITKLDGKPIAPKIASTDITQTTREIQKAEVETQKLKQTTAQIKPVGNALINSEIIKEFETKVQQVIYDEKELEKITRETFEQFGSVTTNTTKTVSHEIDTFAVKIKNLKTNISETLRFRLNPDSGYYKYQGSSGSDNYARQQEVINKQIEKNNAAVTNYTATLNKLEKEYRDVNATKPIQDTSHLETLKVLLDAAREKVDALKTATKEHYATTEASAKSAITALETQIRLFRQEEYAANQLRAKPIETIKAEQVELLRKFRAEIEASGIAFNKFKTFNIGQLSGKVNGITDKQSLIDYLNSFSVVQTEFKALQAEQKNYSQIQKASADKEKAALKEVENEYQRLIQLAGQIGSTRNQLFGLDKNSPEYGIVKQRLIDIYTEYSKLKMAFATAYPTHNLDDLNAKLTEVYYNTQRTNAHLFNQQAVKDESTAYKELLSLFEKYKTERIALSKISKDSPEYSVVSQQVNKLLGDYQKLRTEFTANYPTHNLDELNTKVQELDYNLNRIQSNKTHKLNEKELAQLDAAEAERYNQALKRMADEQNSRISQEETQYKELLTLVNQLGTAQKELSRTKIDNPEYDTVLQRVQQLSSAYQKAKMEFISAYPTHPLDELKAKLEEIGYVVQKNNDKQLGKQQTALFNELNRVSKEMDSIQIKLQTLKSASGTNEHTEQIKELERQLAKLETVYQEVMTQINNNGGLTDNQYAKIYTDIEMLDAKLKEISASAVDAQNKLKNTIKDKISNGTLENQIQTLENDYRKFGLTEDDIAQKTQTLKTLLSTMDASDDIESVTRDYAAFSQEVVKVQNDVKTLRREQQKLKDEANLANGKNTLSSQIDVWLKKNSAAASEFGVRLREIQQELLNADGTKLTALKREFQEIKRQAELAGKATMSFGDKLKSKLGSLATYFSATMMISYAIQGVRTMYQNVLEVDSAMTELYRVTDLTDKQYSQLYDKMVAGAKEYGVALNDIIESTASWVRLGFEANTASQLAEITAMYQHVTDLDNDTAVKNLVTAYKGYQEELLQVSDGDSAKAVTKIADAYDKLGNEFAISAADVGESLRRSASSLEMAGNSFEEAAGMSTGIAEVTQNAEQAGTTLNVVSLRLRGMKGQLEEIGEEVDKNVESISKMQTHILNLTNGKVNIFKDNGEFKSTYQIFKEISTIWDTLTDTSRADLLETVAGKQRANAVAALISNWSNVEKAVDAASNAEGTAAEENEKYMQSMQGKLDTLNASLQALSNTFLSSNFLKSSIDTINSVITGLDWIIDTLGTIPTLILAITTVSSIKNFGIFSIDKNVDKFVDKIQLFGKSISDIKSDLKSGQGLITSFFSKDITEKDLEYITNYAKQLESGIPAHEAWNNTMNKATVAGQQAAIAYHNGGTSLEKLTKSANTSRIAMIGLQAATTLLNTALTTGITLLIQTGINKLVNIYQEFADRQKEAADAAEEFNNTLNSIEDYQKKIDELRESLDKEGISQADATEKRKELLKIKDELFEMYGDEADKRNAITDAINGETNALLRLQGITAQESNLTNAKSIKEANDYLNERHSYTVDLKNTYTFSEKHKGEIDNFLRDYVHSHAEIDFNNTNENSVWGYNSLYFSGTRDEIIQQITDFNNAIEEEINTNKDLTQDEIQKLRDIQVSNSETINWIADKDNQTLENNHTIIETAAKNALFIDGVYNDLYQKYKDAQSDYNDAIAKGDTDAIETAYKNVQSAYNDLISGIDHDVGQVNKDYIVEYIDGIQEQFESSNIDVSLPIRIKIDIDNNTIPENVIDAVENLNNEQGKIVDWGLTQYGSAFDTDGTSFVQTLFGNIDMDKRAIITWSDELKQVYKDELASWDYDPDIGMIDTVFGGWDMFSNGDTEVAIAFSPIMVDENGNAKLLSKDTVKEYLNGIIKEATHDGVIDEQVLFRLDAQGTSEYGIKNNIKGIIAGIDTDLTDGNDADILSRLMHFSGAYGALGSEVGANMSTLQEYADTLGVSLDSLIDAFVSLGYIQEENINTQKQATFSITEYSDSISEYQKNIKTLQDAYNKLIKGELSENDVLDLIIDKFPDLINYTGDLENGIKALANKEYDVLLSKLKEVDTAHLSEADLNTYKTLISYIGQINSGFDITIDKLTEIQSRIKNTSSLISNLQSMSKEISDNGYLSLSSITTILTDDDYISLRPYLDDVVSLNNQINTLIKEQKNYYNELANQTLNRFNLIEEETKKIEEEYNIDLLNYEKLSNDKKKELENTNAYMLSQINDFINDINDKYDIDVRNYKDATSAKLAILNSFKETAAYSNVEAIPEVAVASAMGGFGNYMFLDRVSDITIRKANEELRTLGLTWQDYVQYKKNGVFSYSSNKSLDDNLALIYEQYKNNSSNVSIDWDKINSSGSSTSSEISNSTSEANKYFDWIERRLKRFANTTKEVFSKVKDYITFSGKNSQLSQAINAIRDEIAVNEQSYQYYMNEANAVGLDPYWQWFVQNGGGNISNIQDSDLSEKISRYQELYDKAIECSNAISGLKETELEYANQMLSNVEKYYSNRITYANADAEYYNSLDTDNLNMTKNFDAIRKSYNEQLSYTQKEQNDLLNTLNSLVANGSIKYQSDEWYEWWGKIQKCNVEIRTLTKSIHDLANERLENIQSFWDNRIADANADAEFYNSLDTDNQNMSKNLDAIRESYNKQLSYTKNKQQELIKELNAMVNSGDIEKYSDKWYEWQEKINECEVSIRNLTKSIHDLANERLENIQSFWDNRIGNYDNAISYINTINGDTTRKGSKNYQQLSSAYNAQISYTQKEISELQAALDKAVKNGDIEKYSDKWYEWVSIIEQGKKTIIELQTSIHHLAVDQFNDIVTKYDNLLNDIEYQENLLTERITQTEEKGYIVSTKFYDALISNEQKNISLLVSQRKELYSKLQQAIKSGDIQEGSEEWYKMIQEINNVDLAIEKANTSIIKFNNSIRDIQWQVFDLLQDKISQITQESNFLINLMENDNLYVKEGRRAGQLTNKGLSTMGLHGVNYNVYMAQAKKYAEEILNIDKQIAKDPYNQDLINRRQELLKLQQDMIISANDEKQAIANMVKEGIDLELNALKKLIDKYNEALDAEKNLYDYQKKIKEQTKEINSLEKQLMAYANDTSEETKTKVQQIKVNLETAKENLQETQYDKFVSDQKKLLDDLYNDYETISNQRLDNIDGLISEMIADINDNANTIRRTLIDKAGSVGYQISSEIKNIWNNKTNPVLSEYGQNFLNTSNNVIIAINSLTSSINNMNKALGITVDTNNKAIRKETAVTPTIIHRGSAMRLYNDNVNNLQNYYNGFKQGSYSINRNQMAWTNENGNSEVIIRKSDGAILTPLAKDDMILNGYATDNLFSMANDPSKFIKDNLFGASQYNGTSNINNVNSNYSVSVDNINLNLPNVKNYEDFFYAAQHDKRFEKMVRAMTVDKLFGGSSLKKYRI